jgi:uncharacterized protein YkwD
MRLPGKGVTTVAVALVLATTGGAVLSRSLLRSGAARTTATQANVLVLLNQQRAAHRLEPLVVDPRLTRAASAHSADMLRRGYFAHNGSQGTWDLRIGRYVKRPTLLGEILEWGAGAYGTPQGIVSTWMHSPEHRRVILTPDLRRIGIGIVTGTYRGVDGVTMATGDLSSGVNAR